MKREMIFLGPPACGKGTQTNRLAEYFNLPHVDTGSLLRAEIKSESENGKIAKQYIDKGQLVPVELVAKIIKDRLAQKNCEEGYILDGFPRSAEQADMLTKINEELDGDKEVSFKAVYFDLDQEILISRIVNRRSCPKCGEIYNIKFHPPKTEGVCDKCGTDSRAGRCVSGSVLLIKFHIVTELVSKGILKSLWRGVKSLMLYELADTYSVSLARSVC